MNRAPTADAGADQTVTAGATVTLSGVGTDPDGDALSYTWTGPRGVTVRGANTRTARFTAPSVSGARNYVFRLTVRDPDGLSATDTVTVTVRPAPVRPLSWEYAVPDQTFRVGQGIGMYLPRANGGSGSYRYAMSGSVPGMVFYQRNEIDSHRRGLPFFYGTPTRAGSYTLTYTATDSADGTRSASLRFTVTVQGQKPRPPSRPAAPTVTPATAPLRLEVTWTAPADNGARITDYDVRYRRVGTTNWIDNGHTGTLTNHTLGNKRALTAGTRYEVQVRATNSAGPGRWSPSAFGTPSGCTLPPTPPSNPSPANGATGVSLTPTLIWRNGDSQCGNTILYNVYGPSTDRTFFNRNVDHHTNIATKSFRTPRRLRPNTTYYWTVYAKGETLHTRNVGRSCPDQYGQPDNCNRNGDWSFTTGAGTSDRWSGSVQNQIYTIGRRITPLTLPSFVGGEPPVVYSLRPSVPGLRYNSATRTLSGTPTRTGTYSMTYTAADFSLESVSLRFTITVR